MKRSDKRSGLRSIFSTRCLCFALCICLDSTFLAQTNSAPKPDASAASPPNLSLSPALPVTSSTPANYRSTVADLIARRGWNELMELTEHLITKNPTDSSAYYWEGIASFQMHKAVNAVQSFRTAESLGLKGPALHEGLGLAYYDLNQFVLFEEQMKIAASEDPNDFAPAYYLGLYRLSIQSDAGGALTYFREAVRLQPAEWRSLYQMGYCLELAGDETGARGAYIRSIQRVEASGQHFGWPYQGLARLDMNTDPNAALANAKRAVEVEPQEPSHHFVLAKAYEQEGDLAAGIKEARTAASQDTNRAAIRYLLFRLYKRAGNTIAADNELKLFQTLNSVYGSE